MHILIVTADPILRTFIVDVLAEQELDVVGVASPRAALAVLAHEACDVVLCDSDLGLGEQPGEWLLAGLAQQRPATRRILMSRGPVQTNDHLLRKPFRPDDLLSALQLEARPVPDEAPPPTRRVPPLRFGAGLRLAPQRVSEARA